MSRSPSRADSEDIPDSIRGSQLSTRFRRGLYIHNGGYWKRGKTPVGTGGFGTVWKETCIWGPSEGQVRAVKHIRLAEKRLTFQSCVRELEALTLFSKHKYRESFVELYGWFRIDGDICIAMEYCEHGNLHDYLQHAGNHVTEPEIRQIVQQILQAILLFHRADFAHRDLKPENILIKTCPPRSKSWHIKISDLGISKRILNPSERPTLVGTLGFMPPELTQLENCRGPNQGWDLSTVRAQQAADVWAIGKITQQLFIKRDGCLPLFEEACRDYPLAAEFVTALIREDPNERPTAVEASEFGWIARTQDERNLLGAMSSDPESLSGSRSGPKGNELFKDWSSSSESRGRSSMSIKYSSIQSSSPPEAPVSALHTGASALVPSTPMEDPKSLRSSTPVRGAMSIGQALPLGSRTALTSAVPARPVTPVALVQPVFPAILVDRTDQLSVQPNLHPGRHSRDSPVLHVEQDLPVPTGYIAYDPNVESKSMHKTPIIPGFSGDSETAPHTKVQNQVEEDKSSTAPLRKISSRSLTEPRAATAPLNASSTTTTTITTSKANSTEPYFPLSRSSQPTISIVKRTRSPRLATPSIPILLARIIPEGPCRRSTSSDIVALGNSARHIKWDDTAALDFGLRFSPNGQYLVKTSGGESRIIDTETGGSCFPGIPLGFSNSGALAATLLPNSRIAIYDTSTQQRQLELSSHILHAALLSRNSIDSPSAFSPNDQFFAIYLEQRDALIVWSIATTQVANIIRFTDKALAWSFSASTKQLLVCSPNHWSNYLRDTQPETNVVFTTAYDGESMEFLSATKLRYDGGGAACLLALCFNKDCEMVAVAYNKTGREDPSNMKVFDLVTTEAVFASHGERRLRTIRSCPSGNFVLHYADRKPQTANCAIRRLEPATRKTWWQLDTGLSGVTQSPLHELSIIKGNKPWIGFPTFKTAPMFRRRGFRDNSEVLAWSADGSKVAIACGQVATGWRSVVVDGWVEIWDLGDFGGRTAG